MHGVGHEQVSALISKRLVGIKERSLGAEPGRGPTVALKDDDPVLITRRRVLGNHLVAAQSFPKNPRHQRRTRNKQPQRNARKQQKGQQQVLQ